MEKLNLDKVAQGVLTMPRRTATRETGERREPATSPPPIPEAMTPGDMRLAVYLELVHFGKRERRCGNCLAYLDGFCPGWGYSDADAVKACMAGAAAVARRRAAERGLADIDTDVVDILLERLAGDIGGKNKEK
ncbi:MAG: hypothetical protein ACOX8W_02900 [bacterium]|jgi:hypothetical protein